MNQQVSFAIQVLLGEGALLTPAGPLRAGSTQIVPTVMQLVKHRPSWSNLPQASQSLLVNKSLLPRGNSAQLRR